MSEGLDSADSFELHAWVDESMRAVNVAEPLYMLGAAVADPLSCDSVRDDLRAVRKGGSKLHWREMDNAAKKLSMDLIGRIDAAHIVVVAAPMDPRRQERARAKCMERLLAELGDLGVSTVFLESRTQSLNARDMRLVEQLRGSRAMPRALRVEIQVPSIEPMLWIPDQILGAVGEGKAGNDRWVNSFSGLITRHYI
ncbi:hypothetical protein OIU93_19980 [Paeniglutamicibacter sp. ZC-3]|uniref:hypothetical protein n=1 Tax=Paeniglutamicibacter sp. ZC-3 TaxID=2986919 RepID=UPI0021F78066|nr:hypothetical protein [Paeniglutamicibacter sp. ZC-3]MCV9996547.1 hypothetical protein [Paeniglutamicibacter sp. ZC-3]